MTVSYTEPLARAWARTRALLFAPFQVRTWLVAGFGAFLAHLAGTPLAGGSSRWSTRARHLDRDAAHAVAERVADWFTHPLVLAGIAFALVLFAVAYAVVVWVSARGQFVWFAQVASGRATFVDPWRRSARPGRSLFLCWAALSFAWLAPLAFTVAGVLPVARAWYEGRTEAFAALVPALLGLLAAGLAVSLVILFANLVLGDFLVPLMARHGEGVGAAWERFRPLLAARFGDFAAYAVFVCVLWLLACVAIVVLGFATLCVGFFLMAIPYVGTVVLLPVLTLFRALGPEFLAQFGPEWDTLAASAEAGPTRTTESTDA